MGNLWDISWFMGNLWWYMMIYGKSMGNLWEVYGKYGDLWDGNPRVSSNVAGAGKSTNEIGVSIGKSAMNCFFSTAMFDYPLRVIDMVIYELEGSLAAPLWGNLTTKIDTSFSGTFTHIGGHLHRRCFILGGLDCAGISISQLICLKAKLQENPIFHGKIYGFLKIFP